jgi:hypothetical protein
VSDWEVGDLAVCVDASPPQRFTDLFVENWGTATPLVRNKVYTVAKVGAVKGGYRGLATTEDPDEPWLVTRFRKIRPDKIKACEEEFRTLLKRKPVSV